ncbi:MAG: single-stranded DNA-binding protein [Victivallales bacterium]
MANLNKVLLIGNLTKDPELRYTPQGSAICDFRIAVNRQYMTSDGQKKEEVSFIDINVWGRQAETCNRFIKKGSQVFVEGRLKLDSWQDKETGKNRSRLFVVAERIQFLNSAAGRPAGDPNEIQGQETHQQKQPSSPSGPPQPQQGQQAQQQQNPPPAPEDIFEVDSEPADDIPF